MAIIRQTSMPILVSLGSRDCTPYRVTVWYRMNGREWKDLALSKATDRTQSSNATYQHSAVFTNLAYHPDVNNHASDGCCRS